MEGDTPAEIWKGLIGGMKTRQKRTRQEGTGEVNGPLKERLKEIFRKGRGGKTPSPIPKECSLEDTKGKREGKMQRYEADTWSRKPEQIIQQGNMEEKKSDTTRSLLLSQRKKMVVHLMKSRATFLVYGLLIVTPL